MKPQGYLTIVLHISANNTCPCLHQLEGENVNLPDRYPAVKCYTVQDSTAGKDEIITNLLRPIVYKSLQKQGLCFLIFFVPT